MTRKKVDHKLIESEADRRSSFRKRAKGVLKKVSELNTLCDVDACAIIFSPYDAGPEVWPSHEGVGDVLNKFRNMSEWEQNRNMVDQHAFVRYRLDKCREQLDRFYRDNERKRVDHLINHSLATASSSPFHVDEPKDLSSIKESLDKKLLEVSLRIESLRGDQNNPNHHQQQQPMEGNNGGSNDVVQEVNINNNERVILRENMVASNNGEDRINQQEDTNQEEDGILSFSEMQNLEWDVEVNNFHTAYAFGDFSCFFSGVGVPDAEAAINGFNNYS